MHSIVPRSLKGLLLLNEGAFLVLLLLTGGLGGLSAYHWQQSSAEAVRINALLQGAQRIRGDMYGQVEEVIRARLTEDPSVLDRYTPYAQRIEDSFARLEGLARDDERLAVSYMRETYQVVWLDMNKVFTDPFDVTDAARMKLLDRAHEEWMLADFESALSVFIGILARRQEELQDALSRWTRLASVLVPVPIALAVLLVVVSVYRLHRQFLNPMRNMTEDVQALSQGALEHRVRVEGVAELRDLADTFNHMADDLSRSRDALVAGERQSALGALVPVVAHNIRNPLASIRATAQLMHEDDAPEELEETREGIIESVDQLERWVQALLSYLHPLKPRRRGVRLSQVTDAAVNLLRQKLDARGLSLERHGFGEEPESDVDPDLMEQAIYGLLNNAAEASPPQAVVRLRMESGPEGVLLQIEDEGSGMSFTPQPTNLTPGPTTKPYGTGLGIPFAFKVIQAHGGELSFQQRDEGGSRVSVMIPRAPAGSEDSHEQS